MYFDYCIYIIYQKYCIKKGYVSSLKDLWPSTQIGISYLCLLDIYVVFHLQKVCQNQNHYQVVHSSIV